MANTVSEIAQQMGRTHDLRFDRLMPGYTDRQRNAFQTAQLAPLPKSFMLLVFKISMFMMLVAIGLFGAASIYGNVVAKGGHATSNTPRQIIIGDDALMVPENLIRFRSQRHSGSLDRLDLYAHWPSMEGYSDARASSFDSLDETSPILFMSLEPRDTSKDMSGRVAPIYEKFFSGPPIDAGNGLVRRAFSADSAYFSEDLYYEADSPYPFAARCIRESDRVAAPFCIRDIHVGRNLSLTYRFHASLLPEWLSMDRIVRESIAGMMAR